MCNDGVGIWASECRSNSKKKLKNLSLKCEIFWAEQNACVSIAQLLIVIPIIFDYFLHTAGYDSEGWNWNIYLSS